MFYPSLNEKASVQNINSVLFTWQTAQRILKTHREKDENKIEKKMKAKFTALLSSPGR
jgi:hypothetical protein